MTDPAFEDQIQCALYLYHDVSVALQKAHSSPLIIEILLESHTLEPGQHIAIVENTIGIPKRVLLRAYVMARERFFADQDSVSRLQASSVLLLLNPEHLSAANFRKKLVLETPVGSKRLQVARDDLCFMESICRSPLHRNTKSPTLWAHRRWLLSQLGSEAPSFAREIDIALAAAEQHPKNYYSWDFLRWYHDYCESFSAARVTVPLPDLIAEIKSWCLRHPSDTSGWSFLLWTLTKYDMTFPHRKPAACVEAFEDVVAVARRLRLRNEAVWVFLRTLSAYNGMPSTSQLTIRHEVFTLFSESTNDQIVPWLKDYASPSKIRTSTNLPE